MWLSQDIRSERARPRWLTERIASPGKRLAGVPIQTTKTQVRVGRQSWLEELWQEPVQNNRTATFFSVGQMP
jgi:hypothetical protein